MVNRIRIEGYYQAMNPNCQFKVICYLGVYEGKHYYNVQILDREEIFPLTQNQILCGNFKIPNKKKVIEINKFVRIKQF